MALMGNSEDFGEIRQSSLGALWEIDLHNVSSGWLNGLSRLTRHVDAGSLHVARIVQRPGYCVVTC